MNLVAHPLDSGCVSQIVWQRNVVLLQISCDVTRYTVRRKERFAGGEDARAQDLTGCDAGANIIRVSQDRGNVENAGKAPASQHLLQCGGKLRPRLYVGVQKRYGKNVDVAVPKPGCDTHVSAIDDGRAT